MEMVEVKTAELSGAALDWSVAKAEGLPVYVDTVEDQMARLPDRYFSDFELERLREIKKPRLRLGELVPCSSYSTDWGQGGPLIEKYLVDLHYPGNRWMAQCDTMGPGEKLAVYGDTPLIAACRAIVAAKLGDTVQVPAELTR